MRNFIFFSLFVVLIIGGGFAYLYFYKEKPKQAEAEIVYHNLSLIAFDAKTGKQISGNYSINVAGQFVTGTTEDYGFVAQRVEANKSMEFFMRSPGYYTAQLVPNFSVDRPRNARIEMFLEPVGNLTVTRIGMLGVDKPLLLNVSADGRVKALQGCLQWSKNFLTLSFENQTLAEPPARLKGKVTKCYDLNVSLQEDQSTVLVLNYREYLPLGPDDSLKIYLLYGDLTDASPTKPVFENVEGTSLLKTDSILVYKPYES